MNPTDKKEKDEELRDNQCELEEETLDTPTADENETDELDNEDFESKYLDIQDKYLRLAAEFDNYRKRTMKEKAEIIKTGGEKVISSILPVLDDMERALKMMDTAKDINAVKEGVDLIYCKFNSILSQDGLKKIETSNNEEFDTDYHEAIALVPAPDAALKGKILDTVQNGYILNDKVIRHAKVVIGE